MVAAKNISWGGYGSWEGPFHRGSHPYVPPPQPTQAEKVLAIVAATEGRCDSVNMYDGQIMSVGPIQNIERGYYGVSDMLGYVAVRMTAHVWDCLSPALAASNARFTTNSRERWRFYFADGRGEVDRESEQRELMLRKSSGKRGDWEFKDREHAKLWAACVASVFEDKQAQTWQAEYLLPRIRSYAVRESLGFIVEAERENSDLSNCFAAAYLTFAINNPARANKHLLIADAASPDKRFSEGWLVDVLRELTFGPNISLYTHRYDAIRPKLEQHYYVDLPDLASELKEWKRQNGWFGWFPSTRELQLGLITLGYDLGPRGADDDFGPKTQAAVLAFERLHEVPNPDGLPDPIMVHRLEQVLEARGVSQLTI